MKEKQHRLTRDHYRGEITAAFTLCVKDNKTLFLESSVVQHFVEILTDVTKNSHCIVPVYCFMPDHAHIVLMGTSPHADLWKTMVSYKQKTGYWLTCNMPAIRWQKDFYDHIIRSDRTIATQIRYILDNPVRRRIVPSWQGYPFKGAVGCSLEDLLNSIM